MKKKLTLIAFIFCLFLLLSLSAFATEVDVNANDVSDITASIEGAVEGDVINITLKSDIEITSAITIDKAIVVNLDFNGKQLSYTGAGAITSTNAGIYLNHSGATLSLNGSNPLAGYDTYTHYADTVKADMTGVGNLVSIDLGRLNINNAYLLTSGNGYAVYANMIYNNDTVINIENSVLRCPKDAAYSAITSKGWKYDSTNNVLTGRILVLDNCVIYGGFYGSDSSSHAYNFNYSKGTSFTNTKFYDFKIVNDCWYNCETGGVAHLMMNSYEDALPITDCIFNNYDETLGDVNVSTATGKQNLKLYNCKFNAITGSLAKDGGGNAVIYVIDKMPTCQEAGSVTAYVNSLSGSSYTPTAVEHVRGAAVIAYPNGYDEAGEEQGVCISCADVLTYDTVVKPIFTFLGYSASQKGDAIALGVKLDNEALNKFLNTNPNITLDYGVYAGVEGTVASIKDGKISTTSGFVCSLSNASYSIVDLKIRGITQKTADTKFVAEFYVCDGEKITLLEKYFDSQSLNDVIKYLDINTQKALSLLETKHKLYYNDDGSFRVLILADLHMNTTGGSTNVQEVKDRVKLLVDRVEPNLVIFTGDNTIGSSTEEKLRANISAMVSYIEEKQIPWCHVYGNHDYENALSEEEQQAIYESYEYCVSKNDSLDLTGTGNYVLGVYNKDDTLGSLVYCLDSGTYDSVNGGYDYIREDQIAWYKDTSEILQEYNNGNIVPALMAFHIPLIENNDAYNNRDNTEIVYEYTGNRNEAICASATDTNLLETVFERGDVKAIVTGHDHKNDYMYNYYGVKLCSSPNISDLTYYDASVQGGRVFDLNVSTMDNVPTKVEYIIDRVSSDEYDDYVSGTVLEKFENDAPSITISGLDGATFSGTLTAEVVEGRGTDGSKALEIKKSGGTKNNAEIKILLSESVYGRVGENEYLIVWADFTNIEFRKASFGIITNERIYRTDDYDKVSSFYYLEDGSSEWVELKHGADGCFGSGDQGSQGINGKKGYFALPLDYMASSGAISTTAVITGLYMYLDNESDSYSNIPFYLDDFRIVKDYNELTN